MKLYLLTRDADKDKRGIYDCYHGFLIRATNETKARGIAAKRHASEGENVWLYEANCVCLLDDGDEGILLDDFHAG